MRRNVCAQLLLSLTMALAAAGAHAATIVVDTTADDTAAADHCSLREAVSAASSDTAIDGCTAGDGDDTITFDPALAGATIVLQLGAAGDDENTGGDLDVYGGGDVSTALTIQGPTAGDAAGIIIDGNGIDRVIDVPSGTGVSRLQLTDLTIRNGRLDGADASGGGIRVAGTDTLLSLDDVRVVDNTVAAAAGNARGGGIYTQGPFSITDSVISGNSLTISADTSGGIAEGGGLYATFSSASTETLVSGSEISANSATSALGDAHGGGIQLVAALNRPPVVTSPIADHSFASPDQAQDFSVDLNMAFSDPDGDDLLFSATSGDPGVAIATVTDGSLVVSPVGSGSTTVSVTADDQRGGTATLSFAVTVGEADLPPTVDSMIPPQAFLTGDPAATIDLTTIFSDPDGDPLSFSAESSNPTVATASIADSTQLVISPGAAGNADITVTADDGRGGTASTNAAVSVEPSNSPPVVAIPIPDQSSGPGSSFMIGLTPVFNDPDGDPLTYTANSSNPQSVEATISGSTLTVNNPTEDGLSATVTVTASDGISGTATDAFTVDFGIASVYKAPGAQAADVADAAVQVHLRNTTVSGNTVTSDGESAAVGGGLYVTGANLGVGLNNVTIARNQTESPTQALGGGVVVVGSEIVLSNSLVAGNTAADLGPDCVTLLLDDSEQSGLLSSDGFNLIGDGSGCGFDGVAGDQVGSDTAPIDPLLGALTDNGGDTRTHALLPGSPAIDAGNPATDTAGSCETTDQRGNPRPVDGDGSGTAECDIGAFEMSPNEPPTVAQPIPNQNLTAGGDDISFDLATVFTDPNGDALTFSATSSNPEVVTATVEGATLTLGPVAPGTATITVTAADTFGNTAAARVAIAEPSATNLGSGGGCALGRGNTGVDPLLWLLVTLSMLAAWRSRKRRPRARSVHR